MKRYALTEIHNVTSIVVTSTSVSGHSSVAKDWKQIMGAGHLLKLAWNRPGIATPPTRETFQDQANIAYVRLTPWGTYIMLREPLSLRT